MTPSSAYRPPSARRWAGYYRWTVDRPPRELLLRTLDHLAWERGGSRRRRDAIELGFGAGTDTLELLRRGWRVLAVDAQRGALDVLSSRVPRGRGSALTLLQAPMEELRLPPSDLVYASFSLPFCAPPAFPALWREIRRSLRPGGHFAGHLFGNRDEWFGRRPLTFHTLGEVRRLARGYRVEMLRETEEEGRSYEGPKHWHFYDLILEKR